MVIRLMREAFSSDSGGGAVDPYPEDRQSRHMRVVFLKPECP